MGTLKPDHNEYIGEPGECQNCGEVGNPTCRTRCMAEEARKIGLTIAALVDELDEPEPSHGMDVKRALLRLRRRLDAMAVFLRAEGGPT